MRSAILLLGLVALTRAWSWRDEPQADEKEPRVGPSGQVCHCKHYGGFGEGEDEVISARLKEGSFRLDYLEKELEKAEDHFEKLKEKARKFIRKVDSDESRVKRQEGTKCEPVEFSCRRGGERSEQCINHMLACDGDRNCHNGRDEDEDICDRPAPPGATFEAHLDGNDPCSLRKPVKVRVVVLSSEPKKYLRSIEDVRVSGEATYYKDGHLETDVLNMEGFYSYGLQAILLHPLEDKNEKRLIFEVRFDDADRHIARGLIYHEATWDLCMQFEMRRVDETHH